MDQKTIVKLDNVKVWYPIKKGFPKRTVGHVKAVDGVSLDIYEGETIGIVGESGCGKTTLGKAMILLEEVTDGSITYKEGDKWQNISELDKNELLRFKRKVQMVFQDPISAMNPMKNIYSSLEEPLIIQKINDKEEKERIMIESLRMVNITPDALLII